MKKKVLFLGNHAFVIFNFRKELIKALLHNGYEVYLSMPYDKDKVSILEKWGCKFIETEVDRRGTNLIKDLKLFLKYTSIIKKIKPDVVLSYTIKPNLYGGIASSMCNVPYISNITGLGSGFKKEGFLKNILKFLYKLSLRKSHKVFFQNDSDYKILMDLNIIKGESEILPGSGVNLTEYNYEKNVIKDKFKFIFIGRIMKDKGIYEYLEAAKKITENEMNSSNIEFLVIGFVESTEIGLETKINEYDEKGIIKYLGYQKDVKPFLRQANCLIQPSHGGEGMSNVLLEAAALGKILIASNIPGCKEVVTSNKNGFVFEAKNTNDLLGKIEKVSELNCFDFNEMSLNSRMKVEKEFDREIVVKKYIQEIVKIMESKERFLKNAKKRTS